MLIHVVESGDNVDNIAVFYGVTPESVIYNNQLVYPYRLVLGQALLISAGERFPDRGIVSNGYAYPFISPWVLERTLPYLSELSVFSYGFTAQGNLIPPTLDDTWMINAARERNTDAILTLTPFDESGNFNNNLISAVVNSPDATERLFYQLEMTIAQKGFRGLDIDFEYILAQDRDAFTAFVENAVQFFNPRGVQVSVALAPKTSATQQGLLYEGKDYKALGAAANQVLLMTYEWGYKYEHYGYR